MILFIDGQLALDHALRLATEGEDVAYWCEWRSNYVKAEDWLTGYGFDSLAGSFQRVRSYLEKMDVDLVFVADSGYGDVGDFYRDLGVDVFGGCVESDRLELWRDWAAELMNAYGIKTPKYEKVTGYQELAAKVREKGEVYVKISAFRGNMETCHVENLKELHAALQRSNLGPVLDHLTFLVSEPIEGVEVGVDAWWNGRDFLRPYHLGNEVKGFNACFGKWVWESLWDGVLKRFGRLLRERAPRFRGEISLEAILNEDGLHVLDITPRIARPAGSLMYYSLDGLYSDVVRGVASGETPDYSVSEPYTAQIGVTTSETKNWNYIGEPIDGMAVTARGTFLGDGLWLAPHENDGVVLYFLECGNSLEEAVNGAYEKANRFVMENGGFNLIGGAWQKFKTKYIPEMNKYGYW
jgi:phosphoribosylamine--glycine ligase